MRFALIGCLVVLAIGTSARAATAQEPAGAGGAALDGGTLPVSLDRIRRRLAAFPPEKDRLLLRLTTRVDVYARAQAIEILEGFAVESWGSPLGGRTGGGIAHGSPTHNEMMTVMTPEFWRWRASSLGGPGFGW